MLTTFSSGRAIAVAGLLALTLSVPLGCRSTTGRTAGRYFDDQGITTSVKTKLVADKVWYLTRIGVKTVNGTVYLDGVVDTAEQRARAAEIAASAGGVQTVVNNIQVTERPTAK